MPRYKKGGKRGLKVQKYRGYAKKFKKDWKASDHKIVIAYSPRICADIMRCTLPYVRAGNLSGAGIQTVVFRGNGMFDPDFSGVGQQPMGFDQWSAFYRRYRVLAYNIKIYAGQQDTSAGNDSSMVFISPQNTSTTFTDPLQLYEQQLIKKKMITSNKGMDRTTFELYVDIAKMRGVTREAIRSEQDYGALNTANPVNETFIHVGAVDATSILDTINIDTVVEINYYCEFYDRETLVRS